MRTERDDVPGLDPRCTVLFVIGQAGPTATDQVYSTYIIRNEPGEHPAIQEAQHDFLTVTPTGSAATIPVFAVVSP